ncbi:FYDLN acid domain-containing protein [[Brevibacterium] frigoritolerans]|nr:FYDLN acid domain-containing protein [Peribacillus frigoritolerans]
MKEHLINQWHCDECEDIFYTDLEKQPEFCPYCKTTTLSDSKVLEANPLKFQK